MFKLDTEHLELQASFKEFAENEVKPLAKEIDETERFPIETVKKMAEMGMMGLPIPEELGGAGVDQMFWRLRSWQRFAPPPLSSSRHTHLCAAGPS